MASKRSDAPHQIDKRGQSYSMLPHAVVKHPVWQAMTPRAKLIVVGTLLRFNGRNNGQITYSTREKQDDCGGCHFSAIRIAEAEVDASGIVTCEKRHPKASRLANEYRLTFASYGPANSPRPATNEYKDRTAKDVTTARYAAQRRFQRGRGKQFSADTASAETAFPADTASADWKQTAYTASAENVETSLVSVTPPADTASAHILTTHTPIAGINSDHQNMGKNHGGHFGASDAFMSDDDLRDVLKAYLEWAEPGAQSRLAAVAVIPGGTLSKFKNGRGLTAEHRKALQLAIGRAWPTDERNAA